MKLLRPFDPESPDLDAEEVDRLKDRREFGSEAEWAVYQAKVFYEILGDTTKAIEMLEGVLASESDNSDLLFCLSECYSRNPDTLDKAWEYCGKGLERDAQSDYGYTIQARVHLAREQPVKAYQSAMNALKLNSGNFEAGVYLGITGFAMAAAEKDPREMELSIENLRTTLSLNPESRRLQQVIKENEQYLERFRQSQG